MPTVILAQSVRRHVDVPDAVVEGTSVAEALDLVFSRHPRLRSYIVDEQGRVRRHVAVFVNGAPLRDRIRLSDGVSAADRIHVIQALSGG